MPRIKDLEQLKSNLAGLSHEDQVLERWGETREDFVLPGETPATASAKPGAGQPPSASPRPAPATAARTRAAAPRVEAPDEGLPPDFASLLADLPLDAPSALAEAAGAAPAADEADNEELGELGELDLDALFPTISEEAEAQPGAEASRTPVSEAFDLDDLAGLVDATPRPEPFGGLGDTAAEEDFGAQAGEAASMPGLADEAETGGFSLADFPSSDLESGDLLAGLGEGSRPPFDAEPPAPTDETEAEDLGEALDEGFPGTEGLPGGPSAAEPGEPAEEGGFALGDFAMPDFNEEAPAAAGGEDLGSDFSFEEAAGALPSEGGPTAEGADEALELGGLGDIEGLGGFEDLGASGGGPAAEAGDEFSIPDFGLGASEASAPEAPSGPARAAADEDVFGGGAADAFDSFSLDASSFGGGAGDLDSQLAALGDEIAPAATFNLDKDWGAGFEAPGSSEAPAARPAARERPLSQPEEKIRQVSLTEAQVDKLQDRLLSFPLNLRIAVEDALANELGTEAQRSRLVWSLVERMPFDEVASLVSRMLKRRITVPDGYEKSTGADFQAEQGSLRYAFRHTILPILRVAVLVLIAAGILGYLGYRFIYRPLAADALYRSGYAQIAKDRYAEAEASFARAGKLREYLSWYYRYAEAYAAKRQYLLAERKYGELLDRHPTEYQGALDWARLEKDQLKYKEATDILEKRVLERDFHNKDALLLSGDIFLEWADEDPAKLEDARRSYATLIQNFGMGDLYLARMLLYFMRVDNLKEVLPLKTHFMAADKPYPDAATLAELGGYLLDKDRLEEVHPILKAAVAKDGLLPEVHYQLARYFHRANSPGEERTALDNAISLYRRLPVLSTRREGNYVNALIWRGDAGLAAKEYIAAETDYAAAAAEYDKALALGRMRRSPSFAAAYAGLAEIAYWQRDDLPAALTLYEKAAADGWDKPDYRYQRGAILYRQGRAKEALEQFYTAGVAGNESPYLLYAFGNALYGRKDYNAAEGFYRRTVDAMNKALEEIALPAPSEKASHAEIAELLMEAENNLGAALWRVGSRLGDARRRAEAMAAFTESTRLHDSLIRDQAPLLRAGGENLGLANMNLLLKPQRGAEPGIYADIEKGMAFPKP